MPDSNEDVLTDALCAVGVVPGCSPDVVKAAIVLVEQHAEIERLRGCLALIAQTTALSAETHRLMAQDLLGGFVDRGEGGS